MREKKRMLVGSLILAGGRSRRMGQPKEALQLGGNSLLGRTVEMLLECTWPVVVVARGGDQQLPPFPLEAKVLHDDEPGKGPLAAMATGMRWLRGDGGLAEQDAVFVTGCDMPYLDAEAVSWLCQQLGADEMVLPRAGGVLQPLCAVYRLQLLPRIEQLRAQQVDSVKTLAEQGRCRVLEEAQLQGFDRELRFLRSVNTPEDYEAARRSVESRDMR